MNSGDMMGWAFIALISWLAFRAVFPRWRRYHEISKARSKPAKEDAKKFVNDLNAGQCLSVANWLKHPDRCDAMHDLGHKKFYVLTRCGVGDTLRQCPGMIDDRIKDLILLE